MIKAYVFILLIFSSFISFSQENNSIRLDSLENARREAYQKKQEAKRIARLEDFQNLDPDSTSALDLSGLNLSELPDLSSFRKLKDLELQGNNLVLFDQKKISSDSLTELNLSKNKWEKLRFSKSYTVKSLKLNDCELDKVPRSIKKLKKLKRLELSGNMIRKLPSFIKKMRSLEEININFNGIQVSEKDIRKLKDLKIVQFIGNEIEYIPDNISELRSVKKLNFSQNNISSLPNSMAELDSLESLILYKNNFDSIPDLVFSIRTLTELDFYYNNLTEIPASINRLASLELLFLSYNSITKIPEELRDLDNLLKLYIHHNELVGLPPWIVEFKKLEVLDVGYNKLAVLPDLSSLKSLKEVDVQENYLSELPWGILSLPNIERVFIRDNPYEITQDEAEKLKIILEGLLEKEVRVSF